MDLSLRIHIQQLENRLNKNCVWLIFTSFVCFSPTCSEWQTTATWLKFGPWTSWFDILIAVWKTKSVETTVAILKLIWIKSSLIMTTYANTIKDILRQIRSSKSQNVDIFVTYFHFSIKQGFVDEVKIIRSNKFQIRSYLRTDINWCDYVVWMRLISIIDKLSNSKLL